MENEIWKPIFDGTYEVSDHGNVRRGKDCRSHKRGFVLKNLLCASGYYVVNFYIERIRKTHNIHRLVAEAFMGPCPEGKEVNHIDGNRLNNVLSNLEYISHRENMKHASELGLLRRGVRNRNAKLIESQVREILSLRNSGLSSIEIGLQYGVHSTNIRQIWKRKAWKHVVIPSFY